MQNGNGFFNFSDPNLFTSSTFRLQYDPQYVTAYSANPNAQLPGSINPSQIQNLSLQNNAQTKEESPIQLNRPILSNISNYGQQQQQKQSPVESGTNLVSSVGKNFFNTNSITSQIDKFGAGLGFSSPATYGTSFGPSMAGAAEAFGPATLQASTGAATGLTSASLSGTLGAAGLGYMGGGVIAHALGLNEKTGSIGGALGAGVGYAGGGAAASALGLQLGAAAGPIGAIVGGIAGAVFGGALGGKPKVKASQFVGGIGNSADIGSFSYASKSIDNSYAESLSKDLETEWNKAKGILGLTQTQQNSIFGGVNDKYRHGGFFDVMTPDNQVLQSYSFDPNDAKGKKAAIQDVVSYIAKLNGVSDDLISKYRTNQNGIDANTSVKDIEPYLPMQSSNQPTAWQKYLTDYTAQQNANAA